jgi:hypothetical protein
VGIADCQLPIADWNGPSKAGLSDRGLVWQCKTLAQKVVFRREIDGFSGILAAGGSGHACPLLIGIQE